MLAFRDLVRRILTEGVPPSFNERIKIPFCVHFSFSIVDAITTTGEKRVTLWKEKILSVVGANGKLLTELVPELERVIGVQPQMDTLSGTEAENRFSHVFQQFVTLFCRFVSAILIPEEEVRGCFRDAN